MFKIKSESEKLLETKPWIHSHYHETFKVEYTRIESWIDEKKIEHAKLTLTDDPVVTADTYELRLRQIKREYQKMKVLPKPKEVIPYHYRNQDGTLSDTTRFKQLVNQGDSSINVLLLNFYK